MKNKTYIITEGEFDSALLSQILPDITEQPQSVSVIAASGYSSALAIARSVLLQTGQPALLLIDADTNDPSRIKEKRDFIEEYVRINGLSCKVILAVPELEILFFDNKGALENALQKTISDEFWQLAQSAPRRALEELAGDRQKAANRLLNNPQFRDQIEQTPIINEIRSFLQAA